MKKYSVLISLFWWGNGLVASPAPWAWCYRRSFSETERQLNDKKNSVTYARYGIPLFTQLIVSWNADRPEQGSYTFSVSARDGTTKAWGGWHTMYTWGATQQQSYMNTTKGLTSYYYVRLEVTDQKKADAFRVRVQAHGGASLADLYALTVATSDHTAFTSELGDSSLKKLPSISIDRVPLHSQFLVGHKDCDRICSPASCGMVAQYLTGKRADIVSFSDKVYDQGLQAYGSWACNTAGLFELLYGNFWTMVVRLPSFSRLHAYLMRGIPVIVSVRGSLRGAPKSYENGHLLVVVGWDARTKMVICHDPAAKTSAAVFKRYALHDFLAAWERSRRLAYCVEPR